MKNTILITAIFLMLFSCGPSVKEKEEIAVLTCNIMGESRNMDAAFRIKEINSAREQIGEDRFLGTDYEISESFELGLCKELVLNDKEYKIKLEDAISAKYEEPSIRANRPSETQEIPENAAIPIVIGPSGEISINGRRIDIKQLKENVAKMIDDNPQLKYVVVSPDTKTSAYDIIRVLDIVREAGVLNVSLSST